MIIYKEMAETFIALEILTEVYMILLLIIEA